MTDHNGITISNFEASAALCTIGESIKISFTFKNGTGVSIPSLNVFIAARKSDFTGVASDAYTTIFVGNMISGESLAKGRSLSLSRTFTVADHAARYFDENSAVRAVPLYIAYEAFDTGMGNFSTAIPLDNVRLLNRRCLPGIDAFSLRRCIGGTENDEGEEVLASMKLSAADTAFMHLRLHYAQDVSADENAPYIDLDGSIAQLLTGVENSASLIEETFSNGSDWHFLLVFGDAYESAKARGMLFRAFANLHLSGCKTGGACFGGFSSSENGEPKLESHYEGYFYRGIHGVNIFSEDETATGGRWIDNKPLYTRMLVLRGAASGVLHNIAAPEGIEQAWIDASASFCVNSNGYVYPLGYLSSGSVRSFVAAYQPETNAVRAGTYSGDTGDFYIKLFYTRTADEAVAPPETHAAFTDSSGSYFIDASDYSLMTEVY